MLVFPQWRSDFPDEGCRVPRWMPVERFAPYLARPVPLPPPLPPQVEDEDSSGSSSSERSNDADSEGVCKWQGCGAMCASASWLSSHVACAHAHAHSDGLFYCRWKGCSRPQKGFNARYKMLIHVRTHTNDRPHTCNQCNKSFSRAENLKIHLRSHSGEKPYVCPYEGCGKAYSNSSDRFKHSRTHKVEKPYCCKVPGCNKRYTDPSSLRKHVKTYQHFSTEERQRRESSDEAHSSETLSPLPESSTSRTQIQATSPDRNQNPLSESNTPYTQTYPTSPKHTQNPLPESSTSYTHIQPTSPRHPQHPLPESSTSYTHIQPTSPIHTQMAYSPPRCALSPTIPPYNPILPLPKTSVSSSLGHPPKIDQVRFLRPLEQMYPVQLPAPEMSYLEYMQMYEHAYRNYYLNNLPFPVLNQNINIEKVFTFEEQPRIEDVPMEEVEERMYSPNIEEMPLNLICTKRSECNPVEEIVRRADLPLDLSTKS